MWMGADSLRGACTQRARKRRRVLCGRWGVCLVEAGRPVGVGQCAVGVPRSPRRAAALPDLAGAEEVRGVGLPPALDGSPVQGRRPAGRRRTCGAADQTGADTLPSPMRQCPVRGRRRPVHAPRRAQRWACAGLRNRRGAARAGAATALQRQTRPLTALRGAPRALSARSGSAAARSRSRAGTPRCGCAPACARCPWRRRCASRPPARRRAWPGRPR